MKLLSILSLVPAALAAPASGGNTAMHHAEMPLPRGWTPIDGAEVARRMAVSPAEDVLRKRSPGDVYLCTKAGWAGDCAVVDFTIAYTCQAIPAPFAYNLGSIGPDRGALCRVTTVSNKTGCDAHGDLFVEYPGFDDLYSHDGQNYGKDAHHIECQECTACQGDE